MTTDEESQQKGNSDLKEHLDGIRELRRLELENKIRVEHTRLLHEYAKHIACGLSSITSFVMTCEPETFAKKVFDLTDAVLARAAAGPKSELEMTVDEYEATRTTAGKQK